MGLGLLGRGIGDAAYLASCGANLIVTDLKSKEALASSVAELSAFPTIQFVLGEHRLEDFRNRDMILKAAGVPLDSPYIQEAEKEGIPVRMSADLFAEISGIPIVGITGTRGKSTVTHMIYSILKEAGAKPVLGGNVRGVSTLAQLPTIEGDEAAVLELDSWQCQGFGNVRMSPHIAVFTTFFPDHLNYYKGELAPYLNDKAQIFLHQKPDDTLVLGEQATKAVMGVYQDQIRSTVVMADETTLPKEWTLMIPGAHNRYNAGLALAAARSYGVPDDISQKALAAFRGVSGRLEFVKEVRGIRFYNDTTATTPEATIAALTALDEGKNNIILIMGGADKGLDMSALFTEVRTRVKTLYLLSGSGTERVRSEVPEAKEFKSLQDAFDAATAEAEAGDAILLSPAFASFGMFTNEFDRGDQFLSLVHAYE